MSDNTGIQWTDATWNPIRGCSRVSEGCRHCYAETVAARFSGPGLPYEGLTTKGKWNGTIRVVEEKLTEPLTWKKPRRVFVNSMSDLFHENVSDETIDRIFAVMALAPQHTFQVLTKRPERMRGYMADPETPKRIAQSACMDFDDTPRVNLAIADCVLWSEVPARPVGLSRWPLSNVWLLVSAEDQPTLDARVPLLLQTPAAVRGVSLEPLLGPTDARPYLPNALWNDLPSWAQDQLDWVIVGGESGPGARPCWTPSVRRIVEQCAEANVACFVKQLGANVRDRNDAGFMGDEEDHWPEMHSERDAIEHDLDGTRDGYQGAPVRIHLKDRKGGDMAEWPEDLRVRQFPEVA